MTARKSSWLKLVAAAIPLTVVALALTFALVGRSGSTKQASADFPHSGLDLAIGSGSCTSASAPASCQFDTNEVFTVDFLVDTLPPDLTYSGYDWTMIYTGVTVNAGSLVQQGAGTWPACGFPVGEAAFSAGNVITGCARSTSGSPSTYTGSLAHVSFTCAASGDLTVIDASNSSLDLPASDLQDENIIGHGESNGQDILHVQCGPQTPTPAATPTPCDGPCPTATPTNTPPPATPTPSVQPGDVNGDGMVNSIDALWVLWYDAGIVSSLAHPEVADLNHDGMINSIDASLILQIEAGLYTP